MFCNKTITKFFISIFYNKIKKNACDRDNF